MSVANLGEWAGDYFEFTFYTRIHAIDYVIAVSSDQMRRDSRWKCFLLNMYSDPNHAARPRQLVVSSLDLSLPRTWWCLNCLVAGVASTKLAVDVSGPG